MEKIILTGADGLIGSNYLNLDIQNFEIIPMKRNICDIFNKNELKTFFKKNKAQYLIHLAWNTKDNYLNSPLNEQYKNASMDLAKYFFEFGGKKIAVAGTCLEYDFKKTKLKEENNLNPKTNYAKAKVELLEKLDNFCSIHKLNYCWGRIFFTYGKNEHKTRLTPTIIENLKNNKETIINSSFLIRDYMHSKDILRAFLSLIENKNNGVVNIASSEGISLGDYALKIAKKFNKEDLIILKNDETKLSPIIIGDNSKLKNIFNFLPEFNLDEGLNDILNL